MQDEKDDIGGMGDKPGTPLPEDGDELVDRCLNDRESLDPHETAECVGLEIAEEYENEEDGGS